MKTPSSETSTKKFTRPLPKSDLSLLSSTMEYRVVTIRQLAIISQRSCQVVRRRLRYLEDRGLIIKRPFGYGRDLGRPEEIVILSPQGLELLSEKGFDIPPSCSLPDLKTHPIDHDLLKNWFRLHWIHQGRCIPFLSWEYLSPKDQPPGMNLLPRLDISSEQPGGKTNIIIPDGIYSIKHKETGEALLFFLEVDMGSETMAGRRKNTNTIYHKIFGYRELFRNDRYKHFEKVFDAPFKGFRLLFLANSDIRVAALSRFARATQPSDFIWLTDQNRMFDHGLSANIWVPGGQYEGSRACILGPALASEYPLLSTRC
jgi:hypothetical protein